MSAPTLDDAAVAAAARQLEAAEASRSQVRPTSAQFPGMTIADAYRVQDAWVRPKQAAGRRIIGRKIGLTSRAMQQAMHIDEPDYGTLLDDMVFDNGTQIDAGRFTDLRIEAELAFVLGRPLAGTDLGADEVMAATDWVAPALELIAARSFRVDPETGRPRGIVDTISDNAAAAGIVLGERVRPDGVDLRWCGVILKRNGIVEETGLAAGVLDHPANGVAWLARRFAAHDIALEPGQVILAGSFTRPVGVAAGDRIEADFGPLGCLSCTF